MINIFRIRNEPCVLKPHRWLTGMRAMRYSDAALVLMLLTSSSSGKGNRIEWLSCMLCAGWWGKSSGVCPLGHMLKNGQHIHAWFLKDSFHLDQDADTQSAFNEIISNQGSIWLHKEVFLKVPANVAVMWRCVACGQPSIQATGYQQLTLGVVFESILRGAEPTDSWAICSHNTTLLSTLSNEGSWVIFHQNDFTALKMYFHT